MGTIGTGLTMGRLIPDSGMTTEKALHLFQQAAALGALFGWEGPTDAPEHFWCLKGDAGRTFSQNAFASQGDCAADFLRHAAEVRTALPRKTQERRAARAIGAVVFLLALVLLSAVARLGCDAVGSAPQADMAVRP